MDEDEGCAVAADDDGWGAGDEEGAAAAMGLDWDDGGAGASNSSTMSA